ncbi:LPD3 domain-containing protein [Sphingopyxis flava]|uniref:Helicase ATP-binding domain-containing protein n=1 Tax=Sphingopyxis flava TaxID=1507287 RepID=A0A1T5AB54_9SPHN|nr:hypothetical protein [Sphingopyxis flava]SKB32251.1 hypothetical protein SAMN06295937_100358 [Sphingopyxis flava]
MTDNPLLDAWDRDQQRRAGAGDRSNPLLGEWDRVNRTEAPKAASGFVDTVMEKVGQVGDFLAESMGLNFASDRWQEERARTGRGALDASVNEGFFDRASSLLERGGASANAGMATTVGALTGSPRIQQRARTLRPQSNMDIEGSTGWEDVKANPGIGSIGNFVLDTTVESLPLMASAAAPYVGIPSVAASQTGSIAQQRAEANGQEDPTLGDVLIAAPFGIGSAVLERTGVLGILEAPGKNAVSRVARAGGKEALTEAAQSSLEYTGGAAGTERGWSAAEMADQMLGGAVGGAGMGAGIRATMEIGASGTRAARSRLTGAPIPKGVREQAQEAPAQVSEADRASPLPTDLIAQGKGVVADAAATNEASGILSEAGLPGVGERVAVRYPDGRTMTGTVADAFVTDAGIAGREPGVKINLDGGGTLDEHISTLADAGVSLAPLSIEELNAAADAIDTRLATSVPPTPQGVTDSVIPVAPAPSQGSVGKIADGGKIAPVADAKALTEKLFPGVRVTSSKRAAGAAGKAGSKSWHVKSGAAVDVAPVKGMTFDQFVQRYRDAGYSIIEALDETDPATMKRTGATGPHWHVVLGTGGTPAAGGTTARIDVGDPFADESQAREGFKASPVATVELPEPGGDLRGEPIDDEWVRFADTSGSLGIPRAQMPQIAAENRGAMVNFLNARGVSHTEESVPAQSLKPTQAEFSTAKVAKARDFTGGDRAILVSSDDHVIDGHHQWLAKRDAGEDVRVIRLGATAKELLDIVPEFPSATTDDGSASAQSSVNISDTPSGKGIAVTGLSDAQRAAISAKVPRAKAVSRADGALVFSKKYEQDIRTALETGGRVGDTERDAAIAAVQRPKGGGSVDLVQVSRNGTEVSNLVPGRDATEPGKSQRDRAATSPAAPDRSQHKLKPEEVDRVIVGESGFPMTGKSFADASRAYRQAIETMGVGGSKTPQARLVDQDGNVVGYIAYNGRVFAGAPEDFDRLYREGKSARLLYDPTRAATPTPTPPPQIESQRTEPAPARDQTGETLEGARNQPSPNRLVTDERAAELRERLKAKLNPNRINSGIDPEIIAIGTELAVYHIEKGARRFAAFAQAIASDLGSTVRDLRQYLRGWYNGARDMMEDMGESVAGMDTPDEVARAMRTLDQWADAAPVTSAPETAMEGADGVQGTLSGGDGRTGSGDAQGAAQDGRARGASAEEGDRGSGVVRQPDGGRGETAERSDSRSGAEAERGATGSRNAGRVSAATREQDGRSRESGVNHRIEEGALDEARGPARKAADNIRAIEIAKAIDAEGRVATAEERAALARYVGWGGLKNAFPDGRGQYGKGFETIGPRLREILTDAEYETARRSIQYAHYTSETIVRSMWRIAQRLGFSGGKVFEPGMGVGNFAGMMPDALRGSSTYRGIEYDHITSLIAKALYPKWDVAQADYTALSVPQGAYDLVIGNPPFSETVVTADPAYKGMVLHDYFFAKSLDAVRPGGLLMFVTSAGTMNKIDTKARARLAETADLVGAIRLPGDAFEKNAGTSVTTDIVILRKRLPGEAAGDMGWVDTVSRSLPTRGGGTKSGAVNAYFSSNSDMVLGEEGFFDKLVAGERYAVRSRPGADLGKDLASAIERLPVGIMAPGSAKIDADKAATQLEDERHAERKPGSFYIAKSGKLMQVGAFGQGQEVQRRGKGVTGGQTEAAMERIKGLVPVRDALRDIFAAELAGNANEAAAARERLNRDYDAFVAKFGPINKAEFSFRRPTIIQQESARAAAREEERLAGRPWDEGSFDPTPLIERGAKLAEIARARADAREAAKARGEAWDEGSFDPDDMPDIVIDKRPNIEPFMDDPESYRLRSIEHYNDDTGEAQKGIVFFRSAITREADPKISSPQDALLYVMNRTGRPDLPQIAALANTTPAQAIEALGDAIFLNPDGSGYQTREQYLSGNVRIKLQQAKEAAAKDPAFERNVAALEAVMPTPLTPNDIAANLGMPWLPTKVIEDFGRHLGLSSLTVSYLPKLAIWNVSGDAYSAASRSEWGTDDRSAPEIIQDALRRQSHKVYRKIRTMEGDKSVLDEAATIAVADKMAAIQKEFSNWVWSDPARAQELVTLYNEQYNSHVAPTYDGSYLTTPGISSAWSWRPHQTRVIARIIQSGNTYMAHTVGAGKTSAMIGAGMEMKRLGLVNKPMYVVPNHMLGQFTKEFYEQYPTARIAVADERRFHTDRRKQFIADVAMQELDAVIITHSSFGFIPMSDDFMAAEIQADIDEYRDLLSEVDKGERITRRNIEQRIEQFEQRLRGLTERRRDQVFTFEEMGVDFLFVDEAHLFRKLDFATGMGNVKGVDPNGSQAAYDLFSKVKYLNKRRPSRAVVLASGTPITNTMAELFSVSRYLQNDELEARNLAQFDAWAGSFGTVSTDLEQDPAGGYKSVTRFSKFVNVPELSVMVRQVMDVVTGADLEQYVTRPQLKGGQRQLINVEQTENQKAYQHHLAARMDAIKKRSGPPKPGDDIILSVIGDGRKSAIDYRLIDASAPKQPSKLERMIDNAFRIWKETKNQPFHAISAEGYSAEPVMHGPAAQMIFSDFGINGDFPVQKYIASELARRGVPKSEIAIISDYKSHVAKQRLFNDLNEGKVRFLIGSTAKMGTGVNAQRRLYALHNMDPQWYPANDEQRNGRIIRQGNMNPVVEIFDYAAKGTYDSQMWGIMARKARFIEGFMRGDPGVRDMEDLGESSTYEQAKALTTSDPRILELTEWKQELEKLMLRRAAHTRSQQSIRSEIASAESRKARAEERIPRIEQDIAQRQLPAAGEFTGKVGDAAFEKRDEFGDALIAALDDALARETGDRGEFVTLGELAGFKVVADVEYTASPKVGILRNGDYMSPVDEVTGGTGLTTRLLNIIQRFDTELERQRESIASAEKAIADYTPRLGVAFNETDRIENLRGRIDALEKQLEAETAAAEKRSAGDDIEAVSKQSRLDEREPVAVLTGDELGVKFNGPSDVPALRTAAIRHYKREMVGRSVTMSDGKPVTFTSRGLRHSTSLKGDILLRLVPAIPAILEKGEIVYSGPGDRRGIEKRIEVAARVLLGDRSFNVYVIVREHTDTQRRQYDLTFDNGARNGGAEGRSSLTDGAVSRGTGDPDKMSPSAGLNLRLVESEINAVSAGDIDAARADLEKRLAGYGIADRVALTVGTAILPPRTAGEYVAEPGVGRFITIALDTSPDAAATLDHEVIHAVRNMGLFLPAEWRSLEAAARSDKAMMGSVRKRYPNLTEEQQVEEAIADRFARWQRGDKERGFVAKAFERLRNVLRAVGEALRGNGFVTADSVMRALAEGEIGARSPDASNPSDARTRYSVVEPRHRFDSDETEQRFRAATEGLGTGDGMLSRLRLEMAAFRDRMTRHWVALPNLPKYAALQQKLRALEAAPQAAKEQTVRMLSDMVKGFTREDMDMLARKVILDDLMWEAESEHELPFGLTPETVQSEKAKIDAILQAQPDQKVWKAAMRRKVVNRKIAQDLIDAGVLTSDRIKNPAYFRHQVLEYARTQQRIAASGKKRLRSPKWAKRMGSSLDINANLLEAEFDWLAKALTDIPVARAIDWIKRSEHNILDRLRSEAKRRIASGIADRLSAAEETLADAKASDAEKEAAAAFIETEKSFRRNIAYGFKTVREALQNNDFPMPREIAEIADNIANDADDPRVFRLLSWLLDHDAPGAPGAATVLKAVSQRKAWQKRVLGKDFVDPMDAEDLVRKLAPEGYTTWQPDEGKLLFTVKTLPEHVLDGMVEKIMQTPGIKADAMLPALAQARNALAMGGEKYSMILPQEVADTLNQLRREDVEGLLGEALAAPLRAWKRWVLINPRRVIKYNVNNLTGDLDAVLAGNPRLLRKTAIAARELAAVMREKAAPSPRYEEAVERGVFDSGLSVQEIPDINRLSAFEALTQDKSYRPDKVTMAALGKVWRGLQGFTQWRENVFRYAAYLDYVERIEAGESQAKIGYGASVPGMVDAVTDPKDRAALLARDLVGDYGAISDGGAWLRTHMIPFWSWLEINTKRYWRLTSNAYSQGVGKGIATGSLLAAASGTRMTAWLAMRAMMVFGAITLWNWLFFGDEEDELSDEQKRQLHIILGRNADGEIVTLRTQGALSDALSWFGYGDAMSALHAYEQGRGSFWSVVAAPFKAPVNKIGTALSPAVTLPLESATGKKLWPDLFATRVLRDRWRNLFQTFSLENEYDAATAKPSRGYGGSWVDAIVYRRSPGEIAYDEARGIAYDWLKGVKGQTSEGGYSSPRSEALRDYRQALRYGDEDALEKAIERMIALGIDDKDLAASIKRAHPLGPIAKKDRAAFLNQLTDEELDKFARAEEWYAETYLGQ